MLTIVGLGSLGNMRGYNLVNYRVFVPQRSHESFEPTRRKPIIATSRLGSLAVISALYSEAMRASRASNNDNARLALGFLAPITLVTQIENGDEILTLLEQGESERAYNLLVDKLMTTMRNTASINDTLLQYIVAKLREKVSKSDSKSSIAVVPYSLRECKQHTLSAVEHRLPLLSRTSCTLQMKIIERGEVEDLETSIDVYLVVIPITLASRLNENVVIFREESRSDVERWNIAIDATISYSIYRIITSAFSGLRNSDEALLFLDTTHGINSLVSALSRNEHIAWITALLKGPSIAHLLRYNSDPAPIPVQRGRSSQDPIEWEKRSFDETLKYNMSYYYSIVEPENALTILRAEIDRLVEQYRIGKTQGVQDFDESVKTALFALYITKLGLLVWSIASVLMNKQYIETDPYVTVLQVKKRSGNVINVTYKIPGDVYTRYTSLLLSIYYNLIADKLEKLYEERLRCEACVEDCKNFAGLCFEEETGIICVSLKALRNILLSYDRKSGPGYEQISYEQVLKYLIEPGMRVILLNEIGKYIGDKKKDVLDRIKYLLPKAFKDAEIDCKDLLENEMSVKNGGQLYCFTPMSKPRIDESNRSDDALVRNFIAHAGLNRIIKGMGIVINENCKTECICVKRPLESEKELLDRFMKLFGI